MAGLLMGRTNKSQGAGSGQNKMTDKFNNHVDCCTTIKKYCVVAERQKQSEHIELYWRRNQSQIIIIVVVIIVVVVVVVIIFSSSSSSSSIAISSRVIALLYPRFLIRGWQNIA